jgi:hypothetical protein
MCETKASQVLQLGIAESWLTTFDRRTPGALEQSFHAETLRQAARWIVNLERRGVMRWILILERHGTEGRSRHLVPVIR